MTRYAVLNLGLWFLALALAYGVWTTIQAAIQFHESEQLPAPAPRISPSTQGLTILAETALQHEGQAALTKTVRIPRGETVHFRQNFFNIAAQNGWFVHHVDIYGFSVVITANEFNKLDRVSTHPIRWILEERNPNLQAKAQPNTEDLVNVRVNVFPSDRATHFLITVAISLTIVLCLLATILASCSTWFLMDEKLKEMRAHTGS